jgi:hypothetical protein
MTLDGSLQGALHARTPHVRYTLVGDDGERDPEIDHDARLRWARSRGGDLDPRRQLEASTAP